MESNRTRRSMLGAAVIAGAAATAVSGREAAGKDAPTGTLKIIGVSCSPRKGKTTAQALKVCLDAAKTAAPGIETELIELADFDIPVFDPATAGAARDFVKLVPKLSDPAVGAIIIGTPVYFGNMTSLCKAFLDHCIVFRKRKLALSGKVAGALAVGGVRNGGQELTIQSVQTALMCQEMTVVGDGRPTAHFGATLVNKGDSVAGDEFGLTTAKNLGRRAAEVAMRLTGKAK